MSDSDRVEHDSMGEVRVPVDAVYGAQTQRAHDNFQISALRFPREFIRALGLVKYGCAHVNQMLGLISPATCVAVTRAALHVAEGDYDDEFVLDIFQTGSGTSTNMNANEVIATVASRESGLPIHPNDHVNASQSSNDVIPACIRLASLLMLERALFPALDKLERAIEIQIDRSGALVKTGRTHLMDAMPLTVGQELSGWLAQLRQCRKRIRCEAGSMAKLPLGGTAVGTGVNAPAGFGQAVARTLALRTGLPLEASENLFAALSSQDDSVALSGQLKSLAVALMKISNDLRWMNSGPLSGLAEVRLPALQPGSSIMPGKVNPVIPEAVAMVCAQVIGNDTTITVAGQSGNFQLNVMLPVIAYNLLQSIEILANASAALGDQCIVGMKYDEASLAASLSRNPILVTALNRVVGYETGAAIAKTAYASNRPVLEVAVEMTGMARDELARLLDPATLTGAAQTRGNS